LFEGDELCEVTAPPACRIATAMSVQFHGSLSPFPAFVNFWDRKLSGPLPIPPVKAWHVVCCLEWQVDWRNPLILWQIDYAGALQTNG
jgi:hypothetical protein